MGAVEFKNVDILFGNRQDRIRRSLDMLDAGGTRSEILEKEGVVVGVTDASLSIEEGELFVLMGLSGSGKSTLLRAVNGLNKVTRGKVLVETATGVVDVPTCNPDTLRKLRMNSVAMVFQQFALLPWRTVRENVGLGLELRGVDKAERNRIVDEKLEMVQLSAWADKFAHELSGGMQQRVGLARAFATDADILLMDEPFSALDPLIRTKLQDELLDLQRALKKTIIFVSHDLDEAVKLGSRIAIMEEGRIVQHGTPEEIILHPADKYVTEFVAHMNPINVLTCGSIMTARENIAKSNGDIIIDEAKGLRVSLDASGIPSVAIAGGKPVTLKSVGHDGNGVNLAIGDLVVAPVEISMRHGIRLRHATGNPVLLQDGGRIVGVVGDREIYRGILGDR